MIKCSLIIPKINIDIELFFVNVSKALINEVNQAILGEVYYNDMYIDFSGLIKKDYKNKF